MNTFSTTLIFILLVSFTSLSQVELHEPREPRDPNLSEKLISDESPQLSNQYTSEAVLKSTKPLEYNENKSGNNNCVNATTLTTAGTPACFNVSADSYQTGELSCPTCTSGFFTTPRSVWFVFEATSASTTLNINTNELYWLNTLFSVDNVAVYGPYTSSSNATANCVPNGTTNLFCIGNYTGLFDALYSYSFATTNGSFYLIQMSNCEDIDDPFYYSGCVWVNPTPANNQPGSPVAINSCGTTFNGTNSGYSPSNGFPGMENLDNNNSTTCPTCTAGDDVPYVVNNDSWFQFCATVASNYSINFSGITNCINGDGLQMTIFRGSPTSLTPIWNATSPSLPGSSQNSPTFSVAAGECIYLMVDGFAADQCDYSYTLTPVGNPCLVSLSAELLDIFAYNTLGENTISWTTINEKNTSHFEILKSQDGFNWDFFTKVEANGYSEENISYLVKDNNYRNLINYYKVEQYDLDGKMKWERVVKIDNTSNDKTIIKTINLIGQEVNPDYAKGVVIYMYSDGSTEKIYKH